MSYIVTPFQMIEPGHIWVGLILTAYILGSIPFGLIIGKIAGIGDIRNSGSGNIGATNMLRVGGKKLALLTFACDALKGAIPVILASFYMPEITTLCAFLAGMGHMFPIWLTFKGGKGVACYIGIVWALSGILGLAISLTWLTCAYFTRYSSLSALIATAVAPALFCYLHTDGPSTTPLILLTLVVWLRHHENITRLLKGQESKIGRSKK